MRFQGRLRGKALRGAIAALAILALAPAVALGHPLGNFTINHFAGISVGTERVLVDVVIDYAEIPAFQERQRIDSNGDGTLSDSELTAERVAACPVLGESLSLRADGRQLPLQPFAAGLTFPPGAGGLSTMRLVCEFVAALAGQPLPASISFSDASYAERIGWREIVASGDGVTLDTIVPVTSTSARLTAYPKALIAQPLDLRSATIGVRPGGPQSAWHMPPDATLLPGAASPVSGTPQVQVAGSLPGLGAVPGGAGAEISGIVEAADLTPLAILGSIVLALVLGALHAVSPGHGKTVMAAYLVGTRGTARHAVALGLTVTVSHTLGVLALALVTVGASSVIDPERLYPVLGFASGGLVVGLGLWLLWARFRGWRAERATMVLHAAAHDDAGDHVHLAEDDHAPEHQHAPGHTDAPEHDNAADHAHGGIRHSHLPPAGTTLSWRSLFSLGLAGGLVPSTSALLLLLGSLAAHRPAYGLVLVIAFGAGMAIVLGGIGLALVRAARIVERLPRGTRLSRLAGAAPVASACVVVVAGLVLASQAFTQVF